MITNEKNKSEIIDNLKKQVELVEKLDTKEYMSEIDKIAKNKN